MSRRLARSWLAFAIVLFAASCGTLVPTPTPPPPTQTKIARIASPLPTATVTLSPTDTPTPAPTDTPTPTPIPTIQVDPALARAGLSKNVWFMSQLIDYFSKLGDYPPEPIVERPEGLDPLTGLPVSDPALMQRRPLLARIGNDPQARPQAGLNEADLVFEELIDQNSGAYALTRFTAVFYGQTGTVRPFRSARTINASLLPMFDGALAHSGASKGTRFLFSQLPWGSPVNKSVNLDDLFISKPYCTIGGDWRSRYVSTVDHLHEVLNKMGLDQSVQLAGFDFADTPPPGTPAPSFSFDHKPWPVSYVGLTKWEYDEASGRYLRFVNGAPHNTQQYTIRPNWGGACAITGTVKTEQISAANVVVINAQYDRTDARDFTEDSLGSTSVFIELTGAGPAEIFRDGVQISGYWVRPTLQHFFRFVDANGNTIPLKPGNTWFEIAPLGYAVTVK